MLISAQTIDVPLYTDEMGIIRIAGTRLPIERLLHAYQQGETVEDIVDSYSALTLPDVYAVLSYYLTHQDELDDYLLASERAFEESRQQSVAQESAQTQQLRLRLRQELQ